MMMNTDTQAQTAEQTSNNDGASQSAANIYQPAIEYNTLNGDNELTLLQVHNSLTGSINTAISRIEGTEKCITTLESRLFTDKTVKKVTFQRQSE